MSHSSTSCSNTLASHILFNSMRLGIQHLLGSLTSLHVSTFSPCVWLEFCHSGAKALGGIPSLKCLGQFLKSSVALETDFPTLEESNESVRGQLLFHQISTHYFEKKITKKNQQGSGILSSVHGTWQMMNQLGLYLSVVWLRSKQSVGKQAHRSGNMPIILSKRIKNYRNF